MRANQFAALEEHALDDVGRLLASGADPNAEDDRQVGWTVLKQAIEEAAQGGPVDAITLILRAGGDVNATGQVHGASPLLIAVLNRHLESVRLLLAAGANTYTRDDEGDFPLLLSVQNDDLPMTRLLLLAGAAATIDQSGGLGGMTSLAVAVGRLNCDMVEPLLSMGANPDVLDSDRCRAIGYLPAANSDNARQRERILELFRRPDPASGEPPTLASG